MASFRFQLFLSLVTLYGICPGIDSSPLPDGWVEYKPDESTVKYYRIFAEATYDTARETCKNSLPEFQTEPDLASINCQEEVNFVSEVYQDYIEKHQQQNQPQNDFEDQLVWIEMKTLNPENIQKERGSIFVHPMTSTEQIAVALVSAEITGQGIPKYVLVDKSKKLRFVCEVQPST